MAKRSPNPVDAEVGRRIRLYRTNAGLSQSELGRKIGVTFQQVQK
ncbi:MAG: helix-turn-helix transcriptional regulator, partial [Bradyrhizobium sp.]